MVRLTDELRDGLGYLLDAIDHFVLGHRVYGFCVFIDQRVFAERETRIRSVIQPRYEQLIAREDSTNG